MVNKKISSLGSLGGTPDVADIIPITDVSDTTGSVNGTTKKVTVANLVAAAPQGDLVASNNLSDVASAGTARTNLGLGTAASQDVGTADTNVIGVSSGTVDLGGNKLEDFDASINEQTGTAYTLVAGDNGKVIKFTNGSAITLTLPSGLGEGFNCTVIQYGAGQITFSGTFYNQSSHTKTAGQYAVTGLISCVADAFVLAGDTAS